MDVLTDVLRHMQVSGNAGGGFELGAPWSMAYPEMDEAVVHIVSRGGCFLRLENETAALGPGDLAFLAHGTAHSLSDDPTRDPADFESLLPDGDEQESGLTTGCRHIEGGGDGARTTIICAKFLYTSGDRHPLLSVLPSLIVLRSEDMMEAGWLEDSLRFIAREARSSEPGAQIAFDRLLDLLFVQTVRAGCGPMLRSLPDGSERCLTLKLARHWGAFTKNLSANGALPISRARSACRGRASQHTSRSLWASHRCVTWLAGA